MMLKQYFRFYMAVVGLAARACRSRRTRYSAAATIVFDPTMFASQLQQLQQETATVTNLAQQLQYAIKNTTGGGAGVWQSNQNLLTNLGGLISEQQGLSYTFQGLAQQFQQLYPGYNVTSTPGVQSPQASVDTTLNTLNGALQSAQAQAQNFQGEQATLQSARDEESDRGRQSAGRSGEQRDRARPGPADPDAAPARDGRDEFSEHRRG